jgi:hypothetical protein
MKHRKLVLAALALAAAVLPGWSHAAELAGAATLAAPASCPAGQSTLAARPVLSPWSAPSALEVLICGPCSDTPCQGLAVGATCVNFVFPSTCQAVVACVTGPKCECRPGS